MSLTSTRLGRYVLWNRPTSHDHLRFPSIALRPGPQPLPLPNAPVPFRFAPLTLRGKDGRRETELEPLLEATGTEALLVVSAGQVVFEWYGQGGSRNLPGRCFSVTKSFTSALVGIAIDDGFVGGVDDPVGKYLTDLAGQPIGRLSLRHLMEMRSGIRYVPGPLPWQDDAIAYYDPDCRAATRQAPMTEPVGSQFHYNDYHLHLVGMILEAATGEAIADYFERRLWRRIGAESPASLMIDSESNRFVHLESGLNATARDLARFGLLYLRNGMAGDEQVVPRDWVSLTTGPEGARRDKDWFAHYSGKPWGRVFAGGKTFYKLFWWGYELEPGDADFFAMGALGQHIYVSPKHDTVIVRLSSRFPKGMWWPPVFRQLAEQTEHADTGS